MVQNSLWMNATSRPKSLPLSHTTSLIVFFKSYGCLLHFRIVFVNYGAGGVPFFNFLDK